MPWHRGARSGCEAAGDLPADEPEHHTDHDSADDIGTMVDADVGPADPDHGHDLEPQRVSTGPSQPESTIAANTAELAWPDGNDDVLGRRTWSRSSPVVVGRSRRNRRLMPWFTMRLSAPSSAARTMT